MVKLLANASEWRDFRPSNICQKGKLWFVLRFWSRAMRSVYAICSTCAHATQHHHPAHVYVLHRVSFELQPSWPGSNLHLIVCVCSTISAKPIVSTACELSVDWTNSLRKMWKNSMARTCLRRKFASTKAVCQTAAPLYTFALTSCHAVPVLLNCSKINLTK